MSETAENVKSTKAEVRPRYSGILAHPVSFRSPYGIGDLGQGAYDFIDFLDRSGQSLWQCLPLGPTGFGDSPYQAFSAFACQPLIISPDLLLKDGFITEADLQGHPDFDPDHVEYGPVIQWKNALLAAAYRRYLAAPDKDVAAEIRAFHEKNADWLDDYCLFMTLKGLSGGVSWHDWKKEWQNPTKAEKAKLMETYAEETGYYVFVQYLFRRQWLALRTYANDRGIRIVGDIPIFVSPDSADVWANKSLFCLDDEGYPTVVAGVPPDYFSATGQLWGNPLYNWNAHKKAGYAWWVRRVSCQLELVDYLRIDHFRGLESYWAVPYGAESAIGGKWVKGPGRSLFKALEKHLGKDLPIFAEDLGIITPQVEKLRDACGFPGMKILQFAFNSTDENSYLPYMYNNENCICYTGTHDNDTTVGWYQGLSDKARDKVRRYVNSDGGNIHWDMIRLALGSTARYAIFPMQDLLGLGSECRMNTPASAQGNWAWRFPEGCLNDGLADYLKKTCEVFGRDRARMAPADVTEVAEDKSEDKK